MARTRVVNRDGLAHLKSSDQYLVFFLVIRLFAPTE